MDLVPKASQDKIDIVQYITCAVGIYFCFSFPLFLTFPANRLERSPTLVCPMKAIYFLIMELVDIYIIGWTQLQ